MTSTEKELYNEKITGVYSLIQANADVQSKVNENILATLARIETQTKITNGRVTVLEAWKWKVIGIFTGITIIIGIISKFI